MNKLLSATALVALLTAAPVYAQDNTAPAQTEQPAMNPDNSTMPADPNAPAAMNQDEMANPADQPMDTTAQTDQTNTDQMNADAANPDMSNTDMANTDMANAAPGFISNQSESQILATGLIGQTVYNNADESLGDINDVLIGTNGEALAVIIGVGGFLGIGEKNVAVPYAALQATQDSDANIRLVLAADREEIENAPEFVRLQDQPNDGTMTPDAATTSSTDGTMAPTDGTMAPADQVQPPAMAPADDTGNMNPDAQTAPATNQ